MPCTNARRQIYRRQKERSGECRRRVHRHTEMQAGTFRQTYLPPLPTLGLCFPGATSSSSFSAVEAGSFGSGVAAGEVADEDDEGEGVADVEVEGEVNEEGAGDEEEGEDAAEDEEDAVVAYLSSWRSISPCWTCLIAIC